MTKELKDFKYWNELVDIEGYEGDYKVNRLGEVWSFKKLIPFKMKQRIERKGYRRLQLFKNKNDKVKAIHRLVAFTFIPNPENLPEVDHIDNNKSNNKVDNLQWLSSLDNTRKDQAFEVNQYNEEGKFIKKWICSSEIEKELKLSASEILRCCIGNRNCRSAYGYIWRYFKDIGNTKDIEYQSIRGRRKVNQYTLNGKFIKTWKSLTEASKLLGVGNRGSNIINVCRGRQKTTGGFIWKYTDEA